MLGVLLGLILGGCAPAPTDDPDVVAVAPTDVTDPETDVPTPDEIVVLSLNLHCLKLEGTGFASNADRFAAIARLVASEGVHAIAAQEICRNAASDAREGLLAALATATGDAWTAADTDTHVGWAGTPDEAQEGVAVFVRGASTPLAPLTYAVQGPLGRAMVGAAWTLASGRTVQLWTVHLDYDASGPRRAQARASAVHALVHAPADFGVIVAGDFNATIRDDAVMDFEAAGFDRWSAASDPKGREIDHVFAPRAAGFAVVSARLAFRGPEPVVSDHPGVLVRVRAGPLPTPTVTRWAAEGLADGAWYALRGDRAPLSWDRGWPATRTGPGRWEVALHGMAPGSIAYKWLSADAVWELGADRVVDAGASASARPAFP